MQEEHIKRRHRELSKQQAIYVAQRAKGQTKQASAIMAGYKVDENGVVQVEKSEKVKDELARVRAETAGATGITKEQIAQGLLEAAKMANTMADPQAMVRAYAELGKLLGHYAPEKKVIEHNMGERTLEAMRALPDSELVKLAKGRVIEGEVLHVEQEKSGEPERESERGSESDQLPERPEDHEDV